MEELVEGILEELAPMTIHISDGRPCETNWHGEVRQGILHAIGSDRFTGKVEYEDGSFWDVPWRKITALDTSERMDEMFGVDDGEDDE